MRRHFQFFLRAREAAVMPIVGLALFVLIGATALAVDMGRAQMVQSKLSMALDAAGLAAGASINVADVNAEVQKYFNANYPSGYMGATVSIANPVVSADNLVISLTATASVPTTFMQVAGVNTINVSATSQVTRGITGLEVVMLLDNTGSMADPVNSADSPIAKIDALKVSATDLVGILLGGPAQNVHVALIPFTDTVNITTNYPSWMDPAYDSTLDWGPTSWAGCVMARPSPYDITDDPPSVQLFQEFYWPSGPNGENNVWRTVNARGRVTYTGPFDNTHGPNMECPQPLTPMTSDQGTLTASINQMTPAGATTIDIGLAWAWRMLSPNWQGLWGGEMNAAGLPANYSSATRKVVILMTDGRNEMHDDIPDNHYTAYGFLDQGVLGNSPSVPPSFDDSAGTEADTELDTRTRAICDNMKSRGIIIYTIGFGSGSDVNVDLLTYCATQPSYFFLTPTNEQLQTAFETIADSLASLRVSQ